jgi:hypothetical protein
MCDIQVTLSHPPSEPIAELGAWCVGPITMTGPRVQSQLVAVVPSLP